ncbi:MAG TPA: acetylxylan esterase [Opitutus sp.]|nr:acetylxylan esterase [Opitutus sp.]
MPAVDLPLAELKHYPGLNPRPAEFDAYWAEALRELDATPPQPELIPTKEIAPKNAECFELWFTGVGGARVFAKYLRPKNAAAGARHPAVLQFHGYSWNSGDWTSKLAYANEGFCYAAMDCRGQGGRSSDPGGVLGNTLRGHIIRGLDDPDPRKLLYRQIFLDTVQLARVVMGFPEVDPARVGCCGASQGGGLTLACAALEPRIKRAAPVYPFLCDYQRVWAMDLAVNAYEELRDYFRRFDPLHVRERDVFTKLGYIDCQHLAPRIKADVLMFTGLMDEICPPSSQFAAFNKLASKKEMAVYPDYAHEGLPGESERTFAFMQGL